MIKNFQKIKRKIQFSNIENLLKKYCNGDGNWNIRKVEISNKGYTCNWLEEKKNLRECSIIIFKNNFLFFRTKK